RGGEHGNVGLREEFAELGMRLDVVGQDDARNGVLRRKLSPGDGREQDVVAVAGGDDDGATAQVLHDALGGHGADNEAFDADVGAAGAGVEPAGVDVLSDLGKVGAGEDGLDGEDTEERNPEALETAAG